MREKLEFLIKKHEKLLEHYENEKKKVTGCDIYHNIYDKAFDAGIISAEKNIIKDLKDLLEEQ